MTVFATHGPSASQHERNYANSTQTDKTEIDRIIGHITDYPFCKCSAPSVLKGQVDLYKRALYVRTSVV